MIYFVEEKIYQKFILGTGEKLDYALKHGLGGVIFFTKDIKSKEQFKSLINVIKNRSHITPFLSIDQEGGRVERTENIHERFLSPKFALVRGKEFLEKQTYEIATELADYGINLNFSPCADVNTNPNNPIIGERSFSNNPTVVSNAVKLVSGIYRKLGIIPCLKHFPGHGDASKDSHLFLPEINLPLEKMESVHIKPFRENIDTEMIMVAHLYCTCFDNEPIPSSLSKNVVGYLRNKLNYQNVIITDDMVMKGVQSYGSVDACIKAILAGVDMFIYREANIETIQIIQSLVQEIKKSPTLQNLVIDSNLRIQKLKERI